MLAQLQRDFYENFSDDEDMVSCEWTKDTFLNSSDPALIKWVEEKYEYLYRLEQGVIVNLKIAFDEMFNMSDVVINFLQEFFKNFSQDSVSNYPSENVALLVQQINDVTERLEEVPALPRDLLLLILTGFTKCSVPEFVGSFKLMLNTERVIQLENYGDRHDDSKFLERVKKLTLLVINSFHYLNLSTTGTFHLTIGTECPK